MVHGPASSVSPGILLEIQISWLSWRQTESTSQLCHVPFCVYKALLVFGCSIDLRPVLLKLWVFSLISKGCYSSVIKGMNRETKGKTRDFLKFHFPATAAAAGKSLQLCPTPCDATDSSPPGSPVPGILEARTLEWIAISFSSAWKWKVKVKSLSRVRLLATPWTAAYQAPPSMWDSRQEYWSGLPLSSPTA